MSLLRKHNKDAIKAKYLRYEYNDVFFLRNKNREKMELIKSELDIKYDSKLRLQLGYLKNYDLELKSELIDLDSKINELLGYGENINRL